MGEEGTPDGIMDKQGAYFTSANLARAYDLAGPSAPSRLHTRNLENAKALGGMRRPDLSVQRNPLYRAVGKRLHAMAASFIGRHPETLAVINALRAGQEVAGFSDEIIYMFRSEWFATLGATETPRCKGPDPGFMETWGRAVQDEDSAVFLPMWLRTGAPLGILEPIDLAGVFPPVEPTDPVRDPSTLHSELAGWTNYSSAEDEPAVVKGLLDDQEAKGHCRFFTEYGDLLKFLNVEEVVLSKLGLITKLKPDGKKKHRLIWDLLRSDVNSTVDLRERIVLPRIQDAVDDARELRASPGDLEWLVLDISDAFHNIPLRASERRYACGRLGDLYILFLVLCMGGKSAPNIWGRYAAWLGRLLASLFEAAVFRNEVYVDDPLMAAVGTVEERSVTFTIALMVLQCTGFPLAWAKGTLGSSVTWIGAQLSNHVSAIAVSIPEDKLDALRIITADLRASVVNSKRVVRSYCGKISFVAGMLPALRPFLAMLWGALSARSNLPGNLVHTRQMRVPLDWIHALLHEHYGPMVRSFPLTEQWAEAGTYIATDACPWGMGGVLFQRHVPVAWFATPLTHWDLRRFQASRGEPKHNTTWEALALLLAIRLWLPGTHVLARIRSDSLSALRSMVKLASSSPALNLIARELALDAVQGLYTIGMATHIPGVSNILPDDLSRMWAPQPHAFPPALQGVPECVPQDRSPDFWKSTSPKHRSGFRARTRASKAW